jgi:hypothetical protein
MQPDLKELPRTMVMETRELPTSGTKEELSTERPPKAVVTCTMGGTELSTTMATGQPEPPTTMATVAMEPKATIATDVRELIHLILAYRWIWDGQVVKFFSEQWWTRIPNEVTIM